MTDEEKTIADARIKQMYELSTEMFTLFSHYSRIPVILVVALMYRTMPEEEKRICEEVLLKMDQKKLEKDLKIN